MLEFLVLRHRKGVKALGCRVPRVKWESRKWGPADWSRHRMCLTKYGCYDGQWHYFATRVVAFHSSLNRIYWVLLADGTCQKQEYNHWNGERSWSVVPYWENLTFYSRKYFTFTVPF